MINALINGIITLVINLVNLLLIPIDNLIASYLPALADALELIQDFFYYIGNIIPFVLSYTGIQPFVFTIIYDIIVFILTVPLLVHAMKLAVQWYDKVKV